jgi:very-short-patch-repair endonuclease
LWQIEALGLTATAVRSRAARGRLYRLYRGVYSLVPPHQLKPPGHWMAAVLACGPGAVLSHRSAAKAHELRGSQRSRIDVTTRAGTRGRRIRGIDAHSAATLTTADITTVGVVPVTSVARTVLDLAAVTDRRTTELVVEQAIVLGSFDLHAFNDVLARNPTHAGVPHVVAVLERFGCSDGAHAEATRTDSALAEAFLALIRSTDLTEPETEQWITLATGDTFRVDFVWRAERLIVETDGRRTHLTPLAFQADRTRDQLLSAAGWRILRFTWDDVHHRRAHTVTTVRAMLAAALIA